MQTYRGQRAGLDQGAICALNHLSGNYGKALCHPGLDPGSIGFQSMALSERHQPSLRKFAIRVTATTDARIRQGMTDKEEELKAVGAFTPDELQCLDLKRGASAGNTDFACSYD